MSRLFRGLAVILTSVFHAVAGLMRPRALQRLSPFTHSYISLYTPPRIAHVLTY